MGHATRPNRHRLPRRLVAVAILAALLSLPVMGGVRPSAAGVPAPAISPAAAGLVAAAGGLSPLGAASSFLENRGQLGEDEIRYSAVAGDLRIAMVTSGFLIESVHAGPGGATEDPAADATDAAAAMSQVVIRVSFDGSNPVVPKARGPLAFLHNYLQGNDPSQWRTGVRSYREVIYDQLYDRIDLVFRATPAGLKYEFLLRPGADPARIRWSYRGATSLSLEGGSLVIRTGSRDVLDAPPTAVQGGRAVACAYSIAGESAGFACSGWDPSEALTIDPLLYSSFLGGGQDSRGVGIAIDGYGDAYVTGFTMSVDFPVTPGSYQATAPGNWDVFVAKLSPSGTGLVYATFLGGSGSDKAFGIAVDASGDAFLAGYTNSTDFPTTAGAFRRTFTSGGAEAFVAELNPAGSGLVYSTFLGGTTDDRAYALALDGAGEAFVAGRTKSPDFPVTAGAFETGFASTTCGLTLCGHGFLAKLTANGSALVYASFIGGTSSDRVLELAVDASGDAYLAGYTNSSNFPVTAGALSTTFHGGACGTFMCSDGFVAKVNPSGSSLLYSTFLGGSKTDQVHDLAIDTTGDAYLTGETNSTDFPVTAGAFQTRYPAGSRHAFVAELNPAGTALVYSTFLGGSNADQGHAIALDAFGDAVVVGRTNSSDFPTTQGAYDTVFGGGSADDAFVAELSPAGDQLLYSTYLGGSADDWANAAVLDGSGNAYVTGHTMSANFPTTAGAFRTTFVGIVEAFATRLALIPGPTVRILSPSPGAVATVSVTVTGSSARATLVQVRPGSAAWTNATGVASWTVDLNLTSFPAGPITIEARAWNGTVESARAFLPIQKTTAALTLDRCTVTPAVAAVQIGTSQAFAARGWNGSTEIAGVSAMWSSSGAIGNITAAGMFTGTAAGSGTVTASVSYGGRSATCSASLSVTTGPPPSVMITSPTDGATVTTDVIVVRGVASQADVVQVRTGNGSWTTVAGPLSVWSTRLDLASVPNGQAVIIEARAFNGTVESTHDAITIVKVLVLSVTISYPLNGAQVSGVVTVMGTATAGSTVRLRFDGGPWQNVSVSGTSWSYGMDMRAAAVGNHVIEAQAVEGVSASPIVSRIILVANAGLGLTLFPPPVWLVLLVLVLVAIAAVMAWRRRRRRATPPRSVPPPPPR